MKRATSVVLLATAASLLALAAPVVAQTVDYGGVCVIFLDPANPAPGSTATVSGRNFPPNTSQPIMLDDTIQVGMADVDAEGTFSSEVTLPTDLASGQHVITVFCDSSGFVATVAVTVTPPGQSATTASPGLGQAQARTQGLSGGNVAITGSDIGPKVVVALVAISVGGALVMAAHRRRHRVPVG